MAARRQLGANQDTMAVGMDTGDNMMTPRLRAPGGGGPGPGGMQATGWETPGGGQGGQQQPMMTPPPVVSPPLATGPGGNGPLAGQGPQMRQPTGSFAGPLAGTPQNADGSSAVPPPLSTGKQDGGLLGGTGGPMVDQQGPLRPLSDIADPAKGGSPTAPPQASGGYKPPFLLGFETSKLMDPNKGEGESGKYTASAKAFGQAYLGGNANISRGNLQPAIDAVKGQFPNAKAVGDDKIDFGDGKGPIDVIGSDGTVRFQNTTDNAQYMSQRGGGGGGGHASGGGGGIFGEPTGHVGGGANLGLGSPIGAGDWAALGLDPNKIGQDAPIPGMPGKVAHHEGSGWQIGDAGGGTAKAPAGDPRQMLGGNSGGTVPVGQEGGGQGPMYGDPRPGGDQSDIPPGIRKFVESGGGDTRMAGQDQGGGPNPTTPHDPAGGHGGLDDILNNLLGGGMNQDIVNNRVDQARGTLQKNLQSGQASQDAMLAERGLMGSGPEALAMQKLNEGGQNDLNSAVSGIFSDESQAADSRMMQALTTKAGLSVADAQNAIASMNAHTNQQNADTNKMGTEGGLDVQRRGLDLQKQNQDQNYELGKGHLGLDTELGRGGLDVQRRGLDLQNKGLDQNFSLGKGNLDLQRILGMKGLDLQGTGQQLDWNKFAAQFGLDREKFAADQGNNTNSQLLALIQQLYGGAGQASGGAI